jgi:hypothetical protein
MVHFSQSTPSRVFAPPVLMEGRNARHSWGKGLVLLLLGIARSSPVRRERTDHGSRFLA